MTEQQLTEIRKRTSALWSCADHFRQQMRSLEAYLAEQACSTSASAPPTLQAEPLPKASRESSGRAAAITQPPTPAPATPEPGCSTPKAGLSPSTGGTTEQGEVWERLCAICLRSSNGANPVVSIGVTFSQEQYGSWLCLACLERVLQPIRSLKLSHNPCHHAPNQSGPGSVPFGDSSD